MTHDSYNAKLIRHYWLRLVFMNTSSLQTNGSPECNDYVTHIVQVLQVVHQLHIRLQHNTLSLVSFMCTDSV